MQMVYIYIYIYIYDMCYDISHRGQAEFSPCEVLLFRASERTIYLSKQADLYTVFMIRPGIVAM